MDISENFEGSQVTIKAQGAARYFGAAFLGIWLCGWLVGEVVALSFLFVIAWYLTTGELLIHKTTLPQGPGLYAIGGFLLVWGTFWTIGGLGALREFGRLLWGSETILLRPDSIRITHKAFPFSKSREVGIAELRGFSRGTRKRKGLILELAKGRADLSLLGSEEEKLELETLLRRRYSSVLGLPKPSGSKTQEPSAGEARLPAEWVLEALPEGNKGLVRNPAIRRKQVMALWIAAAVFDLLCAFLVYKALKSLPLAPLALMVATAGMACTVGAVRMGRGRPEWVVGRGVLRLQRRSGAELKTLFQGARIELDTSEGESTTWTNLYAVADGAREQPPYDRGQRKEIATKSTGADELRHFGHYLAQQTGLPFIDRTDPGRKGADLLALKERLEKGGSLARWVAGKIKTPEKRP